MAGDILWTDAEKFLFQLRIHEPRVLVVSPDGRIWTMYVHNSEVGRLEYGDDKAWHFLGHADAAAMVLFDALQRIRGK